LSCRLREAKKKKLTIVRFSSKFLGYSQTRITGCSATRADPNFWVIVQRIIFWHSGIYESTMLKTDKYR
jgi:hypothetical protein